MKKVIVTTSWDDGHLCDVRLALLLKKYKIKGTFYISPRNAEFQKQHLLSDAHIKKLSEDFEIGAHTLTHSHLSKVSLFKAAYEIRESKKYLEKLTKKKIVSFCYPYGEYNAQVVDLVKKNGFSLARTTKRYVYTLPPAPFEMATTFHTLNHLSDIYNIILFSRGNILALYRYRNWEYLAIEIFTFCLKNGFVFHLWGHSWEIEKHNAWEKLEYVFAYISQRKNVTYVTNAELLYEK